MRLSAHACHMLHAPHAAHSIHCCTLCVPLEFHATCKFPCCCAVASCKAVFAVAALFFPAICSQDKRFNYKMRLDACDFLTGEWARHVNKRRARGLNEVATAHQNDGWHFDSQLAQLGKCAMHSAANRKAIAKTDSQLGWMAWGGRKTGRQTRQERAKNQK